MDAVLPEVRAAMSTEMRRNKAVAPHYKCPVRPQRRAGYGDSAVCVGQGDG